MRLALSDGRMRFGDLRTTVEGISGKVLTDTLRDLERDGLVARHVHAELPPRVEYELTALAARETYDAAKANQRPKSLRALPPGNGTPESIQGVRWTTRARWLR
ncbi:winged helix-turn-helix transcriptional regulator [Amycolatopsis albispora]|uniref:winged helix-turn-helix transcriptional regulator n=1 Tax=Amycolatopsis albispora TaxID=1804986 RepID=UPI000DE2F8B5|nr:helix-turn-helix domain-containing protein [Amycolatopsis albispora]